MIFMLVNGVDLINLMFFPFHFGALDVITCLVCFGFVVC